jgi:hypothetical protein
VILSGRTNEVRLVLAHADDAAARTLACRWGDAALLLTPEDLHHRMWRLERDRGGAARATIGSGRGDSTRVDAVLSRLGGISAGELTRVRPEDRVYAAAELTAFLLAWLDACSCPVLNPPGAGSLNGPAWQPEQWAMAAARAGLVVRSLRRHVALGEVSDPVPAIPAAGAAGSVTVTVVGDQWFGPAHESTGRRLRDLARAAGTPLLVAALEGTGEDAAVFDVSAWPDVGDPDVADAVALAMDAS